MKPSDEFLLALGEIDGQDSDEEQDQEFKRAVSEQKDKILKGSVASKGSVFSQRDQADHGRQIEESD